jgi:hypothetical protein
MDRNQKGKAAKSLGASIRKYSNLFAQNKSEQMLTQG